MALPEQPNEKTVLIVDDQEILRFGLRVQLSYSSVYQLVGEASDGYQALSLVDKMKPDLVLMDIQMPNMNGIEATRQIKEKYPACSVLMFTSDEELGSIQTCLNVGAQGYCTKNIKRSDLFQAMDSVVRGEIWIDPRVAGYLLLKEDPEELQNVILERLTQREHQILTLVSKGKTSNDIALITHLKQEWVSGHLENILNKLATEESLKLSVKTEALRKKIKRRLSA